jgi:NADH-quinone oxidoreductase subunit E
VTEARAALEERVDRILRRYPTSESALLPLLWEYQNERGWLAPEVVGEIASRLGLSATKVESVASFYTMLHLKRPAKYVIQICASLSCHLCRSRQVMEHLQQRLGIGPGEQTADRRFALVTVHCLGGCDGAPVVRINDQAYNRQTPDSIDSVLDALP